MGVTNVIIVAGLSHFFSVVIKPDVVYILKESCHLDSLGSLHFQQAGFNFQPCNNDFIHPSVVFPSPLFSFLGGKFAYPSQQSVSVDPPIPTYFSVRDGPLYVVDCVSVVVLWLHIC